MCGRFVSASPPDELVRFFGADLAVEQLLEPSYNVAPTDGVYTVFEAENGARTIDVFRWGLVPRWAKDISIGSRMINARADGIAEKNAFKYAFRHRRCLIPADGFYEWTHQPGQKVKQPMFITRTDGRPMAFAGLWDRWRDQSDADVVVRSCTIITTTPNEVLEPIHDRMPVILEEDAWATWLDGTLDDVKALEPLLVPAPSSTIESIPVGTMVNSVRNNGAELIERIDPDELQLFGQGSLL